MQHEYLQNNRRELEICKTVSLKELKAKDASSTINKTWEEIKAALTVPNPAVQMAMLESLNDIILHVSYTARRSEGSP